MHKVTTMYGRVDIIYDYEDFEVGDNVKLLSNRPKHSRAPKYLEEYPLYVKEKGRKNISVATKAFPNESWVVAPCFLAKIETKE